MADVSLRDGSVEDLAVLRPLWVGVHHQHVEVMPELAPYVDDDRTWAVRADLYRSLLAQPDTVLLLAHVDDGPPVGYGLAHVLTGSQTWLADTWATGSRVAEVETLAVAPAHRGVGIGTLLLDTLEARMHSLGVDDLVLGVLAGNRRALDLYRRRGYRPTWLYLSKLAGRDGTDQP